MPSNQGIWSSTYKIPAEWLQKQHLGGRESEEWNNVEKRPRRQTQSVGNGEEAWKRQGAVCADTERKMGEGEK